ncbi:MAG TPA: GxxExxY protein [Chitinispirillaceae bacterium]|nr:GxxExxY protein [Chitinispirillaceae bacterium]
MTENDLKYSEITREIIGAAMAVHSYMGNGFQEVIYQRCLAIELKDRDIQFRREQEMLLFYKNHEVGTRRADFIVNSNILLELKALSLLEDEHRAQTLNYLTAYNLEIGLLINFGAKSLQFERFINTRNTYKGKPSTKTD